jgi:hypothetical protein
MKILISLILISIYIAIFIFGVPAVGSDYSPWFMGIVTVIFTTLLLIYSNVKISIIIVFVVLLTVIFPIAVLYAIGWSAYSSFLEQTTVMFATFFTHGQLWGLEMLVPTLCAAVTSVITNRSKMTPKSGAF